MIEIPSQYVRNLYKLALVFFTILSILYAVRILAEFRFYQNADLGFNSITLSGHGEVSAVPDLANVSFNIQKEAKTAKEAQEAVAVVEKAVLDFLKSSSVEDKDIKTVNASFNPKYDYQQKLCPQVMGVDGVMMPSYYCGGKQILVGYEAYENITVKVRVADDAGKIMQGLGDLGVSDLSGPNFTIDDEDALKAEAKKLAIDDAKVKAKVLAKNLDVKLGKIMSFSDNGDYPTPYYGESMMSADSKAVNSAPAEIPKGENTITADVTITYEIR